MKRSIAHLMLIAALFAGFAGALSPPITASAAGASRWPVVLVVGQSTTWQLSLLHLRKVDRIPGTAWKGYASHQWAFWVLTLKMTIRETMPLRSVMIWF